MSDHLLIVPRLRVQNANCISSPMTWGFPAITAFTGTMVALARKLGKQVKLEDGTTVEMHFESVGVVCHHFEPQIARGPYKTSFRLTRNPVLQDGSSAAIIEEGRAHLDITLVFAVRTNPAHLDEEQRQQTANLAAHTLAGMRVAGGSVMPTLGRARAPRLIKLESDANARATQFKKLRWRLLPGFALVSRDDLLQAHQTAMLAQHAKDAGQAKDASSAPKPTLLDAWLDLSRLNLRAQQDDQGQVTWRPDKRKGWVVPMPVGFAALSEEHPPGSVANTRDPSVPFRFVESVYSMGQWISPHRLSDVSALLWRTSYDSALGLYRCVNVYQPLSDQDDLENEDDASMPSDLDDAPTALLPLSSIQFD